jgi:hypothetical protein
MYRVVLKDGQVLVGETAEIELLLVELTQSSVPWDRDISEELATGTWPYGHPSLDADNGWWKRTLDQIDALTIHHTLSDSPHATANYYVKKNGGRPTIPYTIWITQTGEILKCVDLTKGLWHDHTGHRNTHLSIGLAGTLHLYEPSEPQLQALVKVCVWAVESDILPTITSTQQITGHMDYINTQCPGWTIHKHDHWKRRFQRVLREASG